ncbi:unnamed protein product [Angiostrongylus costaricensis]|uniref:Uncharacterized protein n=1 Tax=Angiostrongylus costaricensis TaxID=334426 RepID=A0A0R3PXF2_ANGCS|nr:unnamed protein product [Angiostrongylus costaricensis]
MRRADAEARVGGAWVGGLAGAGGDVYFDAGDGRRRDHAVNRRRRRRAAFENSTHSIHRSGRSTSKCISNKRSTSQH